MKLKDEDANDLTVYVRLPIDELNTLRNSYLQKIQTLENSHWTFRVKPYIKFNPRELLRVILIGLMIILFALVAFIMIQSIILKNIEYNEILTMTLFYLMIPIVITKILIDDKTGYLYKELKKIDIVIFNKIKERIKKEEHKKEEMTFNKGQNFEFYKNLKKLINKSHNEIFIIDAYVDHKLIELYLEEVPDNVSIKILTKKPNEKFKLVAELFKKNIKRNIEVRTNNEIHDRLIFVDNYAWSIGASIKDAGSKPTYIRLMKDKNTFYTTYNKLFEEGMKLI